MVERQIENLGLACWCQGDPRLLIESVKLADRSGFSGIWLVEVQDVDVLALAAALSQNTEKITIATGVVNLNLRLPTLLAMAAATLSELLEGRFVLGVGAGAPPMRFTTKNRANTPLNRLTESLQIIRGCLLASATGAPYSFSGKLYDVQNFKLGLSTKYRPPVYGAGMGTKTVEAVAKYADGVIMMLPTLAHVRKLIPIIDENLGKRKLTRSTPGEESGSDKFQVACYIVTVVSEDPEEAEIFAKQTVVNYSSIPAYHQNFVRLGFSKEIEIIDKARASGADIDAMIRMVPKKMAEGTVVYGNAAECVRKISEFVRAGISQPIVYPSTSGPLPYPDRINYAIEKFAPFLERSATRM